MTRRTGSVTAPLARSPRPRASPVACAAPPPAPPADPASVLLRRASRLFDGRTFAEVTWDGSLDRLAQADVVFLGETHLDQLTHDAELEFLRGLAARRGGKVTLSMEMFERDVQPAVDDYLAGRIDEATFLARSRPWGNYPTDYRPLIECARREGIPVVAANLPAALRMKLARGGQQAFDALTPAEKGWVPAKLYENPPEYWERVANVTRGHGALGNGRRRRGSPLRRPEPLGQHDGRRDRAAAHAEARPSRRPRLRRLPHGALPGDRLAAAAARRRREGADRLDRHDQRRRRHEPRRPASRAPTSSSPSKRARAASRTAPRRSTSRASSATASSSRRTRRTRRREARRCRC